MRLTGLALVFTLSAGAAFAQSKSSGFEIRTMSARPDLISGGDALVQITVPATLAADKLSVAVNGRDVSAGFKLSAQPNTLVGLVKDLPLGRSQIEAGAKGQKPAAQFTIVRGKIVAWRQIPVPRRKAAPVA